MDRSAIESVAYGKPLDSISTGAAFSRGSRKLGVPCSRRDGTRRRCTRCHCQRLRIFEARGVTRPTATCRRAHAKPASMARCHVQGGLRRAPHARRSHGEHMGSYSAHLLRRDSRSHPRSACTLWDRARRVCRYASTATFHGPADARQAGANRSAAREARCRRAPHARQSLEGTCPHARRSETCAPGYLHGADGRMARVAHGPPSALGRATVRSTDSSGPIMGRDRPESSGWEACGYVLGWPAVHPDTGMRKTK